jgi:hypothetical protein
MKTIFAGLGAISLGFASLFVFKSIPVSALITASVMFILASVDSMLEK